MKDGINIYWIAYEETVEKRVVVLDTVKACWIVYNDNGYEVTTYGYDPIEMFGGYYINKADAIEKVLGPLVDERERLQAVIEDLQWEMDALREEG